MRHRILTCKNHPHLRWSCKDIAWSPAENGGGHYNGCRHLFFGGFVGGQMHRDRSGVDTVWVDPLTGDVAQECSCNSHDLVLAFEDRLVKEN
jgi:hypothetical protein